MGGRYPTGGKINGSHTTMIDAAVTVVNAADRDEHTTKIVLDIIDNRARSKVLRLKFRPVTGGLKVTVYQAGPIQDLYIYTSDAAATQEALAKAFLNAYPNAIINRI